MIRMYERTPSIHSSLSFRFLSHHNVKKPRELERRETFVCGAAFGFFWRSLIIVVQERLQIRNPLVSFFACDSNHSALQAYRSSVKMEDQHRTKRDREHELVDETKKKRCDDPTILMSRFFHSPSPELIPKSWCDEESSNFHQRFGKDGDTALHAAIRNQKTEAALVLIATVTKLASERNGKGATPIMLAAQRGDAKVVRRLLEVGVSPHSTSPNGNSACLLAAHFGSLEVLKILFRHVEPTNGLHALLNVSNVNMTTPLMRAAQEGHWECVKLLLSLGAPVSARNQNQMTALMLAAQRGNSKVCQLLVDNKAELNSQTNQHSTSLMLACRRSHVETVAVLVAAGCELSLKNNRGKTALQIALRTGERVDEMTALLDSAVQVKMMRQRAAARALALPRRLWSLHEAGRAIPTTDACPVLSQALSLPHPVYATIVNYFPPPNLWTERLSILNTRVLVDPTLALLDTLDLMDEVLEAAGLLSELDQRNIKPPDDTVDSWVAWSRLPTSPITALHSSPRRRIRVTSATVQFLHDPPTILERRRHANYFQYADFLYEGIERIADLASLVRRMRYHMPVDAPVALDVVVLASQLVNWHTAG